MRTCKLTMRGPLNRGHLNNPMKIWPARSSGCETAAPAAAPAAAGPAHRRPPL